MVIDEETTTVVIAAIPPARNKHVNNERSKHKEENEHLGNQFVIVGKNSLKKYD